MQRGQYDVRYLFLCSRETDDLYIRELVRMEYNGIRFEEPRLARDGGIADVLQLAARDPGPCHVLWEPAKMAFFVRPSIGATEL